MKINLGKLKLKNPVMVASGTFGLEYEKLVEVNSLGAIAAKTITLKPRVGNAPPRIVETPSGMLNSIGLENSGLDDFVKNKIPLYKKLKAPLIVSIAGDKEDEFKKLARTLSGIRTVKALELNLSCPNVKHGLREGLFAQDEKATYNTVRGVRRMTNLPLIAKLSPAVSDIAKIALAAQAAGADAVSLINTIPGMGVDINTREPLLGNITGGLSGPAIKPVALRMVWETFKKVKIPICGIGGIMEYRDAVEFIICGASAVQVGTGSFVNPRTSEEIIKGLAKYLRRNKINNIKELVGSLKEV